MTTEKISKKNYPVLANPFGSQTGPEVIRSNSSPGSGLPKAQQQNIIRPVIGSDMVNTRNGTELKPRSPMENARREREVIVISDSDDDLPQQQQINKVSNFTESKSQKMQIIPASKTESQLRQSLYDSRLIANSVKDTPAESPVPSNNPFCHVDLRRAAPDKSFPKPSPSIQRLLARWDEIHGPNKFI